MFPDRCVIRSGLPCWVFQGPSVRYTIQAATQLDAAIKLLSMLGYEAKR